MFFLFFVFLFAFAFAFIFIFLFLFFFFRAVSPTCFTSFFLSLCFGLYLIFGRQRYVFTVRLIVIVEGIYWRQNCLHLFHSGQEGLPICGFILNSFFYMIVTELFILRDSRIRLFIVFKVKQVAVGRQHALCVLGEVLSDLFGN